VRITSAPAFVAMMAIVSSLGGDVVRSQQAPIGYDDTPMQPDGRWKVHDIKRPRPKIVAPGPFVSLAPPADAIVLLGQGNDVSHWQMAGGAAVSWPMADGVISSGKGLIRTKQEFTDVQLHVEFATPSPARGFSQDRGNSGVIFMGRYEVQVLDSYENVTYADGQAASIYGEYPPLVNAARKPGEWQTYDIVFEVPKFNGTTLVAPAYITVFWNGVLVQHRRPVMGSTSATTTQHAYTPHDAELPLTLQDHSHPVHYRNIWIRRLAGYDLPEAPAARARREVAERE
jgi:hypothetical protein